MNRCRAAFWWGMSVLALGSPVTGAVEITPSITIGEIYTSNVNLAPSDQEESDWVTRALPGVNMLFTGNRLRAEIDYELEALFYAEDSDRNQVYNHLDADVLGNLVGEDLQLRARSFISQVNVSPELPVSSSNIPVTGNRTDAFLWDIGPEWNKSVLGNSETVGHFRVGHVDYDDTPRSDEGSATVPPTEIQDIDTLDGAVYLRSIEESPRPLRYELAYQYQSVDYETSGDVIQQSTYLRLAYQTAPTWQVFGLVGLDSDFEDLEDDSLNEGRWEAGVAMATEVARFEAALGHRYFGSTWRLNAEYTDDSVSYRLSYDEVPTTPDLTDYREIPVDVPGGVTPPQPPDSELAGSGSATLYLYKRADASVSRTLYRSRASAGLFWERREDAKAFDQSANLVENLDDEKSWGAYADLGWDVGSRTTLGFNVTWENREYNSTLDASAPGYDDDLLYLRVGLDHELGLRTRAAFYTGWNSRSRDGGSSDDYDEYWASVELVRTF